MSSIIKFIATNKNIPNAGSVAHTHQDVPGLQVEVLRLLQLQDSLPPARDFLLGATGKTY